MVQFRRDWLASIDATEEIAPVAVSLASDESLVGQVVSPNGRMVL